MRYDRLDDWLDWATRQHAREIELGLERVSTVWQRLHPSGLGCPVVTVAGTNGKGSCVAMLDAILSAAGYRTGCFTSPHLRRYNERIRVAGREMGDARICTAFNNIDQACQGTSLTYFELSTLVALDIFADEALDAVVLEVGLGGRLDAVNILAADVALVSTVDLDHTHWLGNDRECIGREKAGIFRAGRPALYGDGDPPRSLVARARELAAPLFVARRDFDYQPGETSWNWKGPGRTRAALPYPRLRGEHQLRNAAAVLMALECLDAVLPVGQDAVRQGLESVSLDGRFQMVAGEVTTLLDVAHNAQAVRALARNLESLPPAGRTRAVFGIMTDKDVADVVRTMAVLVDDWHLAGLPGERAMPVAGIANELYKAGVRVPVQCHATVTEAWLGARAAGRPGDRILVFGSFLAVGEALSLLLDSGDAGRA